MPKWFHLTISVLLALLAIGISILICGKHHWGYIPCATIAIVLFACFYGFLRFCFWSGAKITFAYADVFQKQRMIMWLMGLGMMAVTSVAQTADDSLAIVSARWEMKEADKGVVSRCAAIEQLYGGPQYVSIVEIQPRKHCAGIGVSPTMRTMSDLAQEYQALAAINGSYYNMQEGNSVCFLKVDNIVSDSTTAQEFDLRVTGAVKVKKGKLRILPWTRDTERNYKKRKGTILASGPLLLQGGRYADWSKCDSGFVVTKHPRSAIAITKDKHILFIAVDGRSSGNAIGMSIPELAHLIKVMGGKTALNLDGGGSTMLYLDGEILNHPSDNGRFDHQGERRIPNIIYFGP